MTGEELMVLRKRRGLTQAQLGSMVGLSRVQIGRLENGHFNISSQRAAEFRRVLVDEPQLSFADLQASHGEDLAT